MREFVTAKTIKARQDAKSKELEDAQMLRLFDEIYNSSENGDAYYTFIYEQITPSNLKKLKDLGFSVDNLSDFRDGACFKISWA